MKPEVLIVFAILMGFVTLEIVLSQFFKKPGQKPTDGLIEIISTGTLMAFTQPFVLSTGALVAAFTLPGSEGVLKSWPFWSVFLLFIVFDDLTQYWWHRLSHTLPWLYKLHRPHHNASYLSIRIVYRNNLFYYLFMPGLWFSGILIHLGGGGVYAVYIIIKMSIIYGAHSDVRWDAKLYNLKWLSPLMWLVERTISTPATHSAHHGKYAGDGVTHYKGNYGNMLFFWDILFGTAKIARQYPKVMGVENLPETSMGEQLFWPLVKTSAPIESNCNSASIKA